ncbi:MAG: ACP S-malonyltransferase [Dehalococcoidia bacterium]|nr:MAG: ACP S-malonyltransferase [Dehalococcoidia bacterium]
MGRDLYDAFTQAREVFEEADDALGIPLSRLCFEGPEEELAQTVNAQPAILTASIACLKAAASVAGGLICPAFMAGHSLGEYTALVAAQVLDFKEAVRLTRQRGRLMQEAGERVPGGMAAIIGLDDLSVEEICQETGAQVCNLNSPTQIVIGGSRETLVRAMDLARAMGARHITPLKVSGAFHSSLMQPAADGMAQAVSQLDFRDPSVPIVVNSTAQPVTTSAEIKQELLQQLSSCVQWQKSVEYMVGAGVSTFVEIGPGQVLQGLIKRINREAQILNIEDTSSIRVMSI